MDERLKGDDLMIDFGNILGYTGEPCPNCGRLRLEKYDKGYTICEKCQWCIELDRYIMDYEFLDDNELGDLFCGRL